MSEERVPPGNERLEANRRRRLEAEAVERSREEAAPRWPADVEPWGEDAEGIDERLEVEDDPDGRDLEPDA